MNKTRCFLYIAIFALAFVAFNVVMRLGASGVSVDMTEGKIFRLSPAAKALIAKRDEPITLRFFYSDKLANGYPAIKSYAMRIQTLLKQAAAASNGKITVQVIDPDPFSSDEDLAISYGLKSVPVDNRGTKIYFGLAANNSTDDARLIPVFHFEREQFLEYDVVELIDELSREHKPKIGVLTSLPMDAPSLMGIPGLGGGKAWIILDELRRRYDVERIEEDQKSIPKEYKAVIVAQPKKASDDLLYALDQYALQGGRLLFFMDPNAEGKNAVTGDDAGFAPEFNKLFRQWGYEINPGTFVADRRAARKVNSADQKEGFIDYPGWLELTGEDRIPQNDQATAMIQDVTMATPGAITPAEGAKSPLTMHPLVQTLPESMRYSVAMVKGQPDPKKLLQAFKSDNKSYVLAARLTGDATTAFPERKGVAQSASPLNVVIIADTDLLKDEMWAQTQEFEGQRVVLPSSANADFVMNAADGLAGDDALSQLRGKGGYARPFTVVQNIKRNAEEQYLKEEEELQDKLKATETKLESLQKAAQQGGGAIYKREQQDEISRFSLALKEIKTRLRKVEYKLREDIDALGAKLKFYNIWLMPLCLAAVSCAVYWRRRAKSRTSRPYAAR
ncbi:MAG: Gldg family protein [Rickettsiales bacterium]